MDLKNENDFIQYYEDEYKYSIDKYYDNLKDKRNGIIVGRLIIFIVAVLASTLIIDVLDLKKYIEQNSVSYKLILIIYFSVLFLACLINTYNALKKMMTTVTEYIIKDIYNFIGDENPSKSPQYEPNTKLDADSINKMDLFNLDVLKYKGKNYSSIQYNKKNMCFCDLNFYLLEKTTKKKYYYKNGKKVFSYITKRKDIFDGLYIRSTNE